MVLSDAMGSCSHITKWVNQFVPTVQWIGHGYFNSRGQASADHPWLFQLALWRHCKIPSQTASVLSIWTKTFLFRPQTICLFVNYSKWTVARKVLNMSVWNQFDSSKGRNWPLSWNDALSTRMRKIITWGLVGFVVFAPVRFFSPHKTLIVNV